MTNYYKDCRQAECDNARQHGCHHFVYNHRHALAVCHHHQKSVDAPDSYGRAPMDLPRTKCNEHYHDQWLHSKKRKLVTAVDYAV